MQAYMKPSTYKESLYKVATLNYDQGLGLREEMVGLTFEKEFHEKISRIKLKRVNPWHQRHNPP